jgi:hypothetical protein
MTSSKNNYDYVSLVTLSDDLAVNKTFWSELPK